MKTHSFYETACFDPITLVSLAIGAGGLASQLFGPKPGTPKIPDAAPPVQQPVAPAAASNQGSNGPSFLAGAAAPSAMQLGSKSLLGQ
jgi:hypothetical protein